MRSTATISALFDTLPDLRERILMVFVNKNVSHASMAKLGEQRIALRPNFPCGFSVLLSVEREFSALNLRFLYAERAFAAGAIHSCDGGG